MTERRLIESPRIYSEDLSPYLPGALKRGKGLEKPVTLLDLVNLHSESEKQGGGRPEHWEMVFWWTRKPLTGARFVVAASLLPEDVDLADLAGALGLTAGRVAHRVNPDLARIGGHAGTIRNARLLDPFAGFGSIPLEAARLGLREVVAVELLPTAYVFLKAVLEYPRLFGGLKAKVPPGEARELRGILDFEGLARKGLARRLADGYEAPALIVDLARAAKWVAEKLRGDPDVAELYDPDVAVYIGTWEVKHPGTSHYTPLVGNWWLARVRGSGGRGYERIAYMKPVNTGDRVEVEVVDLNRVHGSLANAEVEGDRIVVNGEAYTIPEPNIIAKGESAVCLHDNKPLGYVDPERDSHYPAKNHASKPVRERLVWLPRWALRRWNKMLEDYLNGEITLEELRQAPARPRLLVKVKLRGGDVEFHPATREDDEKLWRALERLRQIWGDPDIPREPMPEYESRRMGVYLYGFNKWFKLFNPRQLLTLVKLVKLTREAGGRIGEEKLREGWGRDAALKYAEAITVYLSLILSKYADYSSLMAGWNQSLIMGHSLSMRGIAMIWNWGDITPWARWSGAYLRNLSTLINSLSYLLSALPSNNGNSVVRVLLDDATVLTGVSGVFDVVVTDPPYYDDVPYSELSDLYYVWLKRALSEVKGGKLTPRFLPEAFYRRVGGRWREVRTQWEEYAEREVSVNPGRPGAGGGSLRDSVSLFEEMLGAAFRAAASRLTPQGVLATYYNHTSVDAWASLLRAGWELAGLRVAAAVPLATESGQRVTARGKVRLDTSIVVVWRRRDGAGRCEEREAYERAVEEARGFTEKIIESRRVGYDVLFAALGSALSALTSCNEIVSPRGRLSSSDVARLAYRAAVAAVAEALSGAAGVRVTTPPGRFYLVTRILFAGVEDVRMDGSTVGIFQIGTGVDIRSLERLAIVARARGGQGSAYRLLYPRRAGRGDLERLLRERRLAPDPSSSILRSSVDALHLLYYHATSGTLNEAAATLRERNRALYEEALSIARILCKYLPQGDPEKALACRVASGSLGASLDSWLPRGTA